MPTHYLFDVAVYVCAGFAAVIPLFLLNIRWAKVLGLIDWPKARGLAEDHVPIVGPSMIIVALATLGVLMFFFPVSPWIITSAGIVAVMGFFDDRRPLPAFDKLFFQSVCAGAVVYLDPQVSSSLSAQYGPWGLVLGALFIVTIMNAVNFVDGIDGLAGIVLLSAFGVIPILGLGHPSAYPYVVMACVVAGSMVPFLYLNVHKRRGFLGNVGSYFFSFLAAVAHLCVPLEAGGPISRLAIAALCFLVPLADTVTVITVRMLSQRSPFRADKGHLHHRLVQTNIPLRQVLAVLGMIQLLGTGTALFLSQTESVHEVGLPVLIFAGYGGITATLILLLERATRIRVQAYFLRLDSGDPIFYLKYRLQRNDKAPIRMSELHRMESKFASEIRITDICVAQQPGTLFVVLRTMAEPLKGISARLEAVIQSEPAYEFHLIERGDFAKRTQITQGGALRQPA